MKNIYKLLIALVVLVNLTELTKAQGTYQTPWPGSSFKYSFGAMEAGNTTKWYVSRDANVNAIEIADPTGDFTISAIDGTGASVTGGVLTGQGISQVKIDWDGAATGIYYVYLKVFDGSETQCFNVKGFRVDVVSGAFNAIAENVTGGTVDDNAQRGVVNDGSIVATDCPDESTINPIANGGAYSLGTTEVVFRVKREFSMNNWHLKFGLSVGTVKYVYGQDNNEITETATNEYDVLAANDYVLVYVTVPNVQDATQDVTLTVDAVNTKDLVTSTTDQGSTPANDPTDNATTYTIKAIPTIGNMVDLN
ncbi:hypothetical protein EO244_02255 [Ancylomarina salipaludis]|uniref:Uncharacterized protein n=1 Tax=Ancylomarina salipaludis TaxID=2501299 RepID=A0A4V1N0L8_9BACT|nr:hypothetical protein [Ancylomarina salipaludis]RXQ97727.1 hypothetical protein EO244_02255 [Ancylomarina salipaludis]